MTEILTKPCLRPQRENLLQDEVIRLRKENDILREIIFGFNNQLLQLQADCVKYLTPDNTECGRDWFISQMLYHIKPIQANKGGGV